jgi:hypothetical protein
LAAVETVGSAGETAALAVVMAASAAITEVAKDDARIQATQANKSSENVPAVSHETISPPGRSFCGDGTFW